MLHCDTRSLVRRVSIFSCSKWHRSSNNTDLHGVMNGELNSILESGLQEIVLAGTEEKHKR